MRVKDKEEDEKEKRIIGITLRVRVDQGASQVEWAGTLGQEEKQ
jgi:hypothetical protein